jgi:hypothetical protein
MSISQGTMYLEGFGNVPFTHTTLVAPPAVKFNAPKHRGECGVKNGKIQIPFFHMGCCGDESMVVQIQTVNIPTQINKEFFAKIAMLLKLIPFLDWDWSSFRRNILAPNKEHITEIFGEFFAKRIMEDLYVVLNNWDKPTEEDELQAQEAGVVLVSHRTFFTEKKVEY